MATRKTPPRKKSTTRKSGRTLPRDALSLLRADHRAVDALLKKYEKARAASQKQKIAGSICEELTVHARIEEAIFYPALRKSCGKKAADLLDEAKVEHASLKELIAQIENSSPSDDLYDAKVKVLGEYVKHHVKEEEGEIFPMARKSRLDLHALGAMLQERKDALSAAKA
ncbi:MAG TPA: hemerythrin domain-containing protein [Rhodanobacteraceae bacterium]|nr:hemerythrin domain-containing protein [Rhodanobacteraceae bacterium]